MFVFSFLNLGLNDSSPPHSCFPHLLQRSYLLDWRGIKGLVLLGSEFLAVTHSSGILMSLLSSHISKFITYWCMVPTIKACMSWRCLQSGVRYGGHSCIKSVMLNIKWCSSSGAHLCFPGLQFSSCSGCSFNKIIIIKQKQQKTYRFYFSSHIQPSKHFLRWNVREV